SPAASTSIPPRSRTRCTGTRPSRTSRSSACRTTTGASGCTPRCSSGRTRRSAPTSCAPSPGAIWPTTRCRARCRSRPISRATPRASSSSDCCATPTGENAAGRSEPARGASGGFRPDHVEGEHRPREALQRQAAQLLDFYQCLDRAEHALLDQDLARLGLAAEAGGHVGHGADRAVVHAALEADRADRRVALGDADAEVELVAALAPLHQKLV